MIIWFETDWIRLEERSIVYGCRVVISFLFFVLLSYFVSHFLLLNCKLMLNLFHYRKYNILLYEWKWLLKFQWRSQGEGFGVYNPFHIAQFFHFNCRIWIYSALVRKYKFQSFLTSKSSLMLKTTYWLRFADVQMSSLASWPQTDSLELQIESKGAGSDVLLATLWVVCRCSKLGAL